MDTHAVAEVRLQILTGARPREILSAKWEYVDFERGIMGLPDSKDRQEGNLPVSRGTGRAGSMNPRRVPI